MVIDEEDSGRQHNATILREVEPVQMDYLPTATEARPFKDPSCLPTNLACLPPRMKPLIDIQSIGPDAYCHRISTAGGAVPEASRSFAALEHCLRDAGDSLGRYFAQAELKFDGLFLGACAVEALRTTPLAVARRITQHFQPA
jgi:hypothetical protein